MGLFEIVFLALGIGFLLAIPFLLFIVIATIYSTPFFLYAAFKLDKETYSKQITQCGIFKTFLLATKFYLQLLCFKKPTLM